MAAPKVTLFSKPNKSLLEEGKGLSLQSNHKSTYKSFFDKPSQKPQPIEQQPQPFVPRTIVDLGGNGACGFRAIAGGIIDKVMSNKALLENKQLLKTLFEEYDRYYPPVESQPEDVYERLRVKLLPSQRDQFIVNMAHVLRQMSVDEMEQNPEKYRGAFVQNNEGTSPEMMRKSTTWIDGSAIAALEIKLRLPIFVNHVEPNKELAARIPCGPISGQGSKDKLEPVEIRLKSGHYQALVKRPELFSHISAIQGLQPEPVAHVAHNDRPLEEILKDIKAHDEQMIETFDSHYDRLTVMLIAGELTKESLLSIYIEGTKGSDYLQGFSRHVERDREYFENALAEKGEGISINKPNETQEEYVMERLIHAIARAMTIGHLKEDVVYDALEEKQSSRMMSI